MMPRDTERDEQAPGLAENRAHPRVKVHSLAYIELGQENAGLIVNISETGMAIQAVQTLSSNYLPRMHFRLPHTDALVQASGKVVWQIKSKKELGIEFDAISEQMREAIRKWIAAEENRQTESEEIHQRALADFAKPVPQGTAFQKYPSESGDNDMEIPVPMTAPELATIDPPLAQPKFENRASTVVDTPRIADTPRVAEPPAPLEFPSAPRRLPDRWRPVPKVSETHAAIPRPTPNRQPERVFGDAAWKRRPAVPASRIESADKRPRWPYALVVILLAAVALAGVTTVDPGLIDTAGIEAWVGRKTAWLKYTPPKNASPTQQAAAASPRTNAALPPTTAPVPPAAQSQAGAATQGVTQSSPANVPPTSQDGSTPNDVAPDAVAPSGAASTATQTPQANDNDASAPSTKSAPTADSSHSDGSESNSAAPRRSPSDSEALQAWRSQTAPPASSNTAPNSTGRALNQTPAGQNNRYQNAQANSAQSAATPPQAFIVEMPGYPSSAVAPSMPLAGVPSGSVAANSQLHAIWVPTNLEWARQYLPGNLGVGRLLSSYSPAYPIEAAREGIQGTVKLDVTVAMDGTVRNVGVLGGPPILAHAAVSAVRDWRYGESFMAGQAIQTQQYVSLVFRLAPTR